ncbi:MAG TPA: ABC transporter ATP-binding protein [Promineifilum sp.]|nr:ABC transporter ATP-binding protein [Promineifilum sp.]HRQ12115.1 ABC transporter ATP-binding protein [Promineifilum sp.]
MLNIQGLSVAYEQNGVLLPAVRDFSLSLAKGQTYGLVGESGSGKTTVAMAILGYLRGEGRITGGRIEFEGRNLLTLPQSERIKVLGKSIALVPQDPMSSLNPSMRVGAQIAEGLRYQLALPKEQATRRTLELLELVRVPDPSRVARSYPHEISGGMQQRALIAMALGVEPELIILDEPTTSLDVTTQAAVLDLLRSLIHDKNTAALYITHNLGVVAQLCDRVAVLYASELVEDGETQALFQNPLHPYTKGLLDSVPRLGQNKSGYELPAIPGRIPALTERPPGCCVFAPRCPVAIERCFSERPILESAMGDGQIRCHRWPEIASGEISHAVKETFAPVKARTSTMGEGDVLDIQGLRVEYLVSRSITDAITNAILGRPTRTVKAVDEVNLSIRPGHTLGLVGESGSGKTTLARTIVGLVERTDGVVTMTGLPLPSRLSERDINTLRQIQFIFQNPEEALNPYLTIGETLQRPFITIGGKSRAEAREGARRMLEAVGLPVDYLGRLPGRLSGGEKQRIAIARAFATNPDLLIVDEPVSSLDVSVQAAVLNLMERLQTENGSAMLFISHDLAVVGYLADRIAVMYAGQIVEICSAETLSEFPHHPYTEALLHAVPGIAPQPLGQTIRLQGDVPSQIDVPSGCRFHPRCPRFLGQVCVDVMPPHQQMEDGNWIACHIPPKELQQAQERSYRGGGVE